MGIDAAPLTLPQGLQLRPAVPPVEQAIAPVTVEALAAQEDEPRPGFLGKVFNSIRNNKLVYAAGAVAVASLATSPLGETVDALSETAPYLLPGMGAAEVAWLGGAGMMLAAIGKKVTWNPLKIHSSIKEIPDAANSSKLFKSGLAINTAAAVTQFVMPTVAVMEGLPASQWGLLAIGAADLWATIVLRRAIWRGIHKNAANPEA
jgi:hypothetical protein